MSDNNVDEIMSFPDEPEPTVPLIISVARITGSEAVLLIYLFSSVIPVFNAFQLLTSLFKTISKSGAVAVDKSINSNGVLSSSIAFKCFW